jgi:hypothetical protein
VDEDMEDVSSYWMTFRKKKIQESKSGSIIWHSLGTVSRRDYGIIIRQTT